jgi:hypothetical protein
MASNNEAAPLRCIICVVSANPAWARRPRTPGHIPDAVFEVMLMVGLVAAILVLAYVVFRRR